MKKIFILTEGGKNIGFGHITRCIALCQAFKERGISPEFILNTDKTTAELLKSIKHKIFNWLKEQQRIFVLIKDADIEIIVLYFH